VRVPPPLIAMAAVGRKMALAFTLKVPLTLKLVLAKTDDEVLESVRLL